jgi:hypothetical protein
MGHQTVQLSSGERVRGVEIEATSASTFKLTSKSGCKLIGHVTLNRPPIFPLVACSPSTPLRRKIPKIAQEELPITIGGLILSATLSMLINTVPPLCMIHLGILSQIQVLHYIHVSLCLWKKQQMMTLLAVFCLGTDGLWMGRVGH